MKGRMGSKGREGERGITRTKKIVKRMDFNIREKGESMKWNK